MVALAVVTGEAPEGVAELTEALDIVHGLYLAAVSGNEEASSLLLGLSALAARSMLGEAEAAKVSAGLLSLLKRFS